MTTGYPFYVVELLKTLFAQGWLTVDPNTGEWIVRQHESADTAVLTLAPSVHDAIAERIECLPDELSAVLISIAVSARGCRADVLSHVHGISRLRAAAAGDALVERHLAVEEDGVYRCAHPVIARVVSDALGTARRREVHRGLALALEVSADGAVSDPGEVARHAEQGGERAMTYRYAMLAAAGCEARFAYEEALGWLDMAAASSGSAADTDAVNVITARLLDAAGWHEHAAPAAASRCRRAGLPCRTSIFPRECSGKSLGDAHLPDIQLGGAHWGAVDVQQERVATCRRQLEEIELEWEVDGDRVDA